MSAQPIDPTGHHGDDFQKGSAGGAPSADRHGTSDTLRRPAVGNLGPIGQAPSDTHCWGAGGAPSADGQLQRDPRDGRAVGTPVPTGQVRRDSRPRDAGGASTGGSHGCPDAHSRTAVATFCPTGQREGGTHSAVSGGAPTADSQASREAHHSPAVGTLHPTGHTVPDAHGAPAGGANSPTISRDAATPNSVPGWSGDALIAVFADALDDLERTRIATENRVRALRQIKNMEGSPEEARLLGMVEAIGKLEHQAELDLGRAVRKHPLGPWIKATVGIGEKQGARLLAAIGDPYLRTVPVGDSDEVELVERTVSQLWAYTGFHVLDGAAAKRRKGTKANWSNTAKMRARLVAESCMKQRHSPYRATYDAGREKYAGRVDAAGAPLSLLHQHNMALRLVAKEVLKDLWREAKRLHGFPTGQSTIEIQSSPAGGDHVVIDPHTLSVPTGHLWAAAHLPTAGGDHIPDEAHHALVPTGVQGVAP